MTIKEYVEKYTSGRRIIFTDVLDEFCELLVEVVKFRRAGMAEEFSDTIHFIQLWLYWRFGVNGELWKITMPSVEKFERRLLVWKEIYKFVGLPENISGFAGNCKKREKVVKQLGRFGIDQARANEAYDKIVRV